MTSRPIHAHLDWLRQRGLREASVRSRLYHLLRLLDFCRPLGYADSLEQLLWLTEDQLHEWAAGLAVRITPAAQTAYISQIQNFYRWAQRAELRADDPTRRLVHPRVPRRRPRPISEADLRTAVVAAPARVKPWLVLAGWTGLRACEIASLQRCDLDLEGPFPSLFVADGKGGKQRTVPLHPYVLETLRGSGLPTSGYLFRRLDGLPGPVRPWLVSHLSNQHLHSLGISATLHQLRHRFGTMAYQAVTDLRAVQELMGHARPQTTAGYAAPADPAARAAVLGIPAIGTEPTAA